MLESNVGLSLETTHNTKKGAKVSNLADLKSLQKSAREPLVLQFLEALLQLLPLHLELLKRLPPGLH